MFLFRFPHHRTFYRKMSAYVIREQGILTSVKQLSKPLLPHPSDELLIGKRNLKNTYMSTSWILISKKFTTSSLCSEEENNENVTEESSEKKRAVDPSKDRTKIIPPEVSIRYMDSKAYQTTYGEHPVWTKYRRNHKGHFPPRLTRESCIRGGVIWTGNPCPICRDEYLVTHYTNVKLLTQFISPYTGEVLTAYKTGVCQKKQMDLEVAIEKAKFYGLITYDVPFRVYDYEQFYPQLKSVNVSEKNAAIAEKSVE